MKYYLIQDEKSEALEAFKKALTVDKERHIALGYLGSLTGSKEKVEEAIKIVTTKLKDNPTHLDLVNDHGKILMKAERYEEAKEQFEKALKENPNYFDAKLNLACALSELNKADQAIELLLGIENKSPRVYFTLGEIFYKTGRLYLAYKAFNKAATIYPTYPKMHAKLTELGNYMRKLETLIDLHERFVNTNPGFPDLRVKLANFYHLAGKTELAIEELKKALEINPDYSYAAVKLEAIQKDIIWRLAKTHLEEHLENHEAVTKELVANIHFEYKQLKKSGFPNDVVLQIRNVRTSRIMQKSINTTQMEEGFARIDCSPLGLVACQDILIFQIVDIKTKKIIRFEPHYLELDEIKAGCCDIKLTIDLTQKSNGSNELLLPKYFLVHLDSKHFADIIADEQSAYRAYLRNTANGLEATGHINPENEEQINFVLNGAATGNGSAAVKPGDRLEIKIEDQANKEIFSMEFSVGNSDIKNLYKTVLPSQIS
ncbi:MAG: hypothetical protein Kow0029_23970 [Candidatus Rifleibacteriota bacterium]